MNTIPIIDLSQLSNSQKQAVLDFIREKNRETIKENTHVINPNSVVKVFNGSIWKPWTWFDYHWKITDPVITKKN